MLDSKDGDTSDVTVRSIKAKDIDNPIPTFHTTLERPGARFRPLDEGEAPPEMEPVQKARGRPAKLSADSILALRPKFPDGIRWCPEDAGAAVDVKRATWFERQKDVASDLVSRGCVFIDGTLRWPTPATEGHSS